MKRLTILSTLSVLLLIGLPIAVFAHGGGDNEGRHGRGQDEQRIEIRAEEDEVAEEAVILSQATFEIRGEITAVGSDTFMVAGQTIIVDPSMVTEFEQEGVLVVGSMVKVEGIISGGVFLAEEIKVE